MANRPLGSVLVVLGIVAIVVGLLLRAGALNWFGRLPGDFRGGSGNVRFYAPITSMLLVSALLSLIAWLLRRSG